MKKNSNIYVNIHFHFDEIEPNNPTSHLNDFISHLLK